MRSMLVIGLGRFGRNLALNLAELGIDVTAVDKNEEAVKKIVHNVDRALIGDCAEKEMLRSLDILTYEVCFVCISSDFQASLEITAQLKELGAKYIVSKTDRDVHTKFLRSNGADDVVYIDRDIAQKTAVRFSAKNAFNYIELEQDYAISDMVVPESWAGRSLKVLELATKYQINVIGVRSGEKVIPVTDPDYVLQEQEHIVIAGLKKDILSLIDK